MPQQLVSAAHSAGVAPRLTVGVAESLYGTSAPQICDALDGGVSSAEALLLKGNPAGRRGKLITNDAITYERLVVQTYCPDQLSTYDDLVADIDATDDHEVVHRQPPQETGRHGITSIRRAARRRPATSAGFRLR